MTGLEGRVVRVLHGPDDVRGRVGEELGTGEWFRVDQARIDAFADATADRQWIHVDTERAATGPYGTTVAHGFLTLSLVPALAATAYRYEGFSARVNYGLDRVRFVTPVPSGSEIRLRAVLERVEETARGLRCTVESVVELRDGAVACVARTITVLVP